MKKRTVTVLSSCAAIAVCSSLIAGATYALFTSEDKVNIAVTAGKVAVEASIGDIKTYSVKADANGTEKDGNGATYSYEELKDGKWYNGGSASVKGGILTLDYITPGDKVEFDINIENKSTVDVKYSVQFKSDESSFDLMDGLLITFGGKTYRGLASYSTAWEDLVETATCPVTVSLPITAGNSFAGLENCSMSFTVAAVQGNAEPDERGKAEFVNGISAEVKEVGSTEEFFDIIGEPNAAGELAVEEPLVIDMTEDIDLNRILVAYDDLVINANGNSLSQVANRGVRAANGAKVIINDAELVIDDKTEDKKQPYTVRGVQFDVGANADITLNNVKVTMAGDSLKSDNYAFNVCGYARGNITLRNCDFTAYQGLNVYGTDMNIVVEDCKFTYVNTHNKGYRGGFITLFAGQGCARTRLTVTNTQFIIGEIKEYIGDDGQLLTYPEPSDPINLNLYTYTKDENGNPIFVNEAEDIVVSVANCVYDGKAWNGPVGN